MATFVSESLWASALQLLCDIPQLQLQGDVVTYSAAIDACGSGRQWQVGLRLLEEMHQVLIRRNAISYTSAMAAMTGCDSWTLALLLSDDMEVAAVESDILAQSQALQAMAMATAWCRCVSAVHGNHGSSAVSVRAVRAVRALEAGSQWPQTLHLVRAMGMTRLALQEASVSASSASGLVGKWRHSMEVMDYLREESAEADLVSSNSVLSAAARSNAWLFSLHYLDLIQCGGSRVDEITMSAAITGCEKGHQWILALSLLGELALTLQLSVIACDAVISSCEKCGKWQEALALLAAMLSWKLIPNEITFNAAIGSCEKGQLCVTETSLRGHWDSILWGESSSSRDAALEQMESEAICCCCLQVWCPPWWPCQTCRTFEILQPFASFCQVGLWPHSCWMVSLCFAQVRIKTWLSTTQLRSQGHGFFGGCRLGEAPKIREVRGLAWLIKFFPLPWHKAHPELHVRQSISNFIWSCHSLRRENGEHVF